MSVSAPTGAVGDTLAQLHAIVLRADAATLRIRQVSGAATELLGVDDTTLGEPGFLATRLPAEDRARVLAELKAATGRDFEHGFVDASGGARRYRSRSQAYQQGAGRCAEILVLMVELPQTAVPCGPTELASTALEDAGVLFVSTDDAGRIQVFSGACEAITGSSPATVRGNPIWELFSHGAERTMLRDAFESGRLEAIPNKFVAHWSDAANDSRVVVWNSRVIRASTGGTRLVFTGADITERVHTEAVLRETGGRYELLLHQFPGAVWTVDRSLRITSSDGAALAGLGLRPGDLVGVSLYAYLQATDPDDPNIEPTLRALHGETVTYDGQWRGRVFQVVMKPLREPSGEIVGALGFALDVTDRVSAERERDRLLHAERAARAEAERLIALRDEFLSIASHELSTPMTSLRLAVESLASGEASGLLAERILALAVRQTQRMSKLIDELLDVSRMRAGRLTLQLEETDLASAARDVALRLGQLAERAGCTLTVRAEGSVVGLWDRSRLEQIISNLITNAIKHARGAPIVVDVASRGEEAVLEVADRGPGIPDEHVSRIFERFERAAAARHHGGLGLGLFIVRQLAEAHGGRVTVESSPDRGTTFRVTLPCRGDASKDGADPR